MKNTCIDIRPYAPETDTEKLVAIWLDASLIAHAFFGQARLREMEALIRTHYLPASETWVACHDGQPVGFVSLIDNFVGGLFVAPTHQGHGVGRQLIAHALSIRNELTLEVYTQNRQAMRFYASLGFQEISRRPTNDDGLPFENARLLLKR